MAPTGRLQRVRNKLDCASLMYIDAYIHTYLYIYIYILVFIFVSVYFHFALPLFHSHLACRLCCCLLNKNFMKFLAIELKF